MTKLSVVDMKIYELKQQLKKLYEERYIILNEPLIKLASKEYDFINRLYNGSLHQSTEL